MNLFIDALIDTAKLLPLLTVVYFIVSFFEYRYGNRIGHSLVHVSKFGPILGALFGCIPQCGFSVVASALYVKKIVSVGTLLAVFLSTSDEAVPILLSIPDKAHLVGILVGIKVIIAIIAGTTVDFVINLRQAAESGGAASTPVHCADALRGHSGCCSHGVDEKRSKIKSLLIHPLWHTTKIFFFLLAISITLNLVLDRIGPERIARVLLNGTLFQPFLTSLIGFIPNCFASVILVGLFVKGAISFGSLVGGLCAGSGIGMLVLIKENKSFKNTLFIIGLLLGVSVFVGVVIQMFGKV
ncbi:MAG: putative manganese transporter [Candidatus Omnitrophica bacterium]|nr:putative manganese transporter [Candidatus Omnitrophota bacterium]